MYRTGRRLSGGLALAGGLGVVIRLAGLAGRPAGPRPLPGPFFLAAIAGRQYPRAVPTVRPCSFRGDRAPLVHPARYRHRGAGLQPLAHRGLGTHRRGLLQGQLPRLSDGCAQAGRPWPSRAPGWWPSARTRRQPSSPTAAPGGPGGAHPVRTGPLPGVGRLPPGERAEACSSSASDGTAPRRRRRLGPRRVELGWRCPLAVHPSRPWAMACRPTAPAEGAATATDPVGPAHKLIADIGE